MTVALMTLANGQFFDNSGNPLSSGTITIYSANTTTPVTIYSDSAMTGTLTNPIVLNSSGRLPSGQAYVNAANIYDIVIKTSAGVIVESYDDINVGSSTEIDYNAQSLFDYLSSQSAGTISYTKTGSSITRTLQNRLEDYISVKDFGAVGNGITNDYTSIQNCINYAFTNAKSVYFPAGTYLCNTQLVISNKDNLRLFGDGDSSVIKYSSAYGIVGTPCLGNTIEDLKFVHSAGLTENYAIYMNSVNVTIRNCTFDSTCIIALKISATSSNLSFLNNTVNAINYGIYVNQIAGLTNSTIANNRFYLCYYGAIVADNFNCMIIRTSIYNNRFDNNGQNNLGTADKGVINARLMYDSQISGNVFYRSPVMASYLHPAILLGGRHDSDGTIEQYTRNVTISNNIFSTCQDGAIYIANAPGGYNTTNININANTFDNNSIASIQLASGIDTVRISNNIEADTTTLIDNSASTNITWDKQKTGVRLVNNTARSNVTGSTLTYTIPFNQVLLCDDTALTGGYAAGSTSAPGTYTVPATGIYKVDVGVDLTGAAPSATSVYLGVKQNVSWVGGAGHSFSSALNFTEVSLSQLYKFTKGDVISITVAITGSASNNWQLNADGSGVSGHQSYFNIVKVN